MNSKTMEGLVGARTNMELLNTPFRVYKEARLKGDTAVMERAMGYMSNCHKAACEYKEEADEGMKEDVEETRRIAEEQREEAIEKRREEREKLEEKIEEKRNEDSSTDVKETKTDCLETDVYHVEISEEGKELLKNNTEPDHTGSDERMAGMAKEPVTYTKTGEAVLAGQDMSISVSV